MKKNSYETFNAKNQRTYEYVVYDVMENVCAIPADYT